MPQIIPQLSRLDRWFTECTFDGAPASGDTKSTTQQMLVRVSALMISRALSIGGAPGVVRQNTVEWIMGASAPLSLQSMGSAGGALGAFDGKVVTLTVGDPIMNISTSGVGGGEECMRKLCHEYNHACRRNISVDQPKSQWMADEFWAYMTELIAGNQTITRPQVTETFNIISRAPYNLRDIVEGDAGKSFKEALKYEDHGTWEGLDLTSIPKPTMNPSWQMTNEGF
jgi:hypothetical protein